MTTEVGSQRRNRQGFRETRIPQRLRSPDVSQSLQDVGLDHAPTRPIHLDFERHEHWLDGRIAGDWQVGESVDRSAGLKINLRDKD